MNATGRGYLTWSLDIILSTGQRRLKGPLKGATEFPWAYVSEITGLPMNNGYLL